MDYESKKVFLINTAYIAVWIALYYFLGRFLTAFLVPFMIAVILSFLAHKSEAFLKKRIKLREEWLRIIILMLFYLIFIFLSSITVWLVFRYSEGIFGGLSSYIKSPDNIFNKVTDGLSRLASRLPYELSDALSSIIDDISSKIISSIASFASVAAVSVASFLPSFLISSVVTVVASFYISKDYIRLLRFLKNMLGDRRFTVLLEIKDIITGSIFRLVGGYLLLSLISFFELWLGFLLLSVKHPLILALITALIDLLPVIGSGTVLVPFSVISFINGNTPLGIGLMVLYIIISLVRNFLEPKIISKRLKISPLLMLLTLFIGLRVGGVAGMLILPVTVVTVFTYYNRTEHKSS